MSPSLDKGPFFSVDPFLTELPLALSDLSPLTTSEVRDYDVQTITVRNPKFRPRQIWSHDAVDTTFYNAILAKPLGVLSTGQKVKALVARYI